MLFVTQEPASASSSPVTPSPLSARSASPSVHSAGAQALASDDDKEKEREKREKKERKEAEKVLRARYIARVCSWGFLVSLLSCMPSLGRTVGLSCCSLACHRSAKSARRKRRRRRYGEVSLESMEHIFLCFLQRFSNVSYNLRSGLPCLSSAHFSLR
jgi:hypothetical protein